MDLVNLQKLIMKDKRSHPGARGFEDDDDDDDEDDDIDYEEEQLNAMMRARFNRQLRTGPVGGSKELWRLKRDEPSKDFLFEHDDDDMGAGFEDLDDEMDDASESYMRQQLFRSNNRFLDDHDFEDDDDPLASWSEKHLNSDDSDDEERERYELGNEIKKSLVKAGVGASPHARASNMYNFAERQKSRFSKVLPKPNKDNLEEIGEILRNNIVPHKKM